MRTALIAGCFDPIHIGHLSLFRAAREQTQCSRLVVALGSDETVRRKHKVLMPEVDRAELLRSMVEVDAVYRSWGIGDCSDVILEVRPDWFVVGADHLNNDAENLPELAICRRLGIEVVYVDSPVKRSSSALIAGVQWDNPVPMVGVMPIGWSGSGAKDGQVLLGRKRCDKRLSILGGFVEQGESLEQAARRELAEETNTPLTAWSLNYIESVPTRYNDGRGVLVSYFSVWRMNCEPLPTEEMAEFAWVSEVPREGLSYRHDKDVLTRFLELLRRNDR